MATPFGHALGGLVVAQALPPRTGRQRLAVAIGCAAFAIAPDLDFLPGIFLGQPALYHQGLTHSLGATLVAGLLGGFLLRRALGSFRAGFLAATLAYASHLVIDLFGPDARPPIGIPILWPLTSTHFQAPFELFLGVRHAKDTSTELWEWVGNVLSFHNVVAIVVEVAVVGPFLALAYWIRRRAGMRKAGSVRGRTAEPGRGGASED